MMSCAFNITGDHHCCLPIVCVCGKQFSVEHAPCCPHGGLPTIHHNEFRDITARLLTLEKIMYLSICATEYI